MKKLIFALFPFALLFGKTEIRLQTIDYEPFVEEMVAEIELKDGEIVSQTINGKEATEEDFEKLTEETGEQIGFETEIVSLQQNAIAEYVGAFLESKGIEYENYGTKLVVEKLDPEIITEITQNFSFVESIEEVEEEVPTASSYKTIDQARKDVYIDPHGDYVQKGTGKVDIGILMQEANDSCPYNHMLDILGNNFIDFNRATKSNFYRDHATWVTNVLQKSSKYSYVYCDKIKNIEKYNNSSPKIYLSNHSYTSTKTSDSKYYQSDDSEIDDFIYKKKIASFVATKNDGKNVGSPGKAYNAVTVAYYDAVNNKFTNIISGNPNTGAIKPEFIAHGFFDLQGANSYGTNEGSSYSTPFITSGFGANLLHQYPFLRYQPQSLKAFLLTMAETKTGGTSPVNDIEGAGELNYKNVYNARLVWWNGATISDKSFTYKLYKGKKYKIAMSWLVKHMKSQFLGLGCGYSKEKMYPEVDLFIYKDGKQVANSEITNSNFELLELTPTTTNNYKFVLKPRIEYCGYCCPTPPVRNLYITLVINQI